MAKRSKIEWTEATWNPVTGCTKISPGCMNCYAERMSRRLKSIGLTNYKNGFSLTTHDKTLELPLRWKSSKTVFVNSMSDLFHQDIPDEFILRTFLIMNAADKHRFQVLTKRSERLKELNNLINWTPNIWLGVSVESKDYLFRINHLRKTRAAVKFISFEPLLGPVDRFNLDGIDWVIVGGESGPNARPMKAEWVIDIKNKAGSCDIPFFFKQWGGFNKKKNGRLLDGRTWDEMPSVI